MGSPQQPTTGDVLLFHSAEPALPDGYHLSVVPGPPQLCIHDRDAAVACAIRYAEYTHACAWHELAPRHWQPLRARR